MQAIYDAWSKIVGFVPKLIGAILVFAVGWAIAVLLEKVALKLFKLIKVDHLVRKTDTHTMLGKVGIEHDISYILAKIVKWFVVIITLSAVVEVLDIQQLSVLANNIILYIPNLFVALIILILGLIGGKVIYEVIESAVLASKIPDTAAKAVASIAKWFVIIFAFMAALVQLKIAPSLIQILFTGFVAMMAIAGGLAFGLGGRDKVKQWMDKLPW